MFKLNSIKPTEIMPNKQTNKNQTRGALETRLLTKNSKTLL